MLFSLKFQKEPTHGIMADFEKAGVLCGPVCPCVSNSDNVFFCMHLPVCVCVSALSEDCFLLTVSTACLLNFPSS